MKTAVREPRLLLMLRMLMLALVTAGAGQFAAAAPAASPPIDPARDLLAHGANQQYWAANVSTVNDPRNPTAKTSVRSRTAGDVEWREIARFDTAATALANRESELLVVLQGGQWAIVSGQGAVRSGVALPGGAEVLDLAGDSEGDDEVWAIAAAPKGKTLPAPGSTPPASISSSTKAASLPSATASASTRPALPPHSTGLFRLERGRWVEQDLLPAGARGDDVRAVSLAVIDRRLMLAVATGLEVRVYVRGPDGGWDSGAQVGVLSSQGRIKLLQHDGRPLLWMSAPLGPGTLFVHAGQRWSGPIRLQPSPRLTRYDCQTLVVALGRLRLLASDPAGRFAEQFYTLEGTLAGEATEALTIPRGGDERLGRALQVIVVVVLVVWMLGSMQQRPATRAALARADRLHLAPLGRRLVGGAIDLIPLLAGIIVADRVLMKSSQPIAARLTLDSPELAWIAAGAGLYLLLATVMELLLGRSIGKLVAGTRVVGLDGRRAAPAAVLIRNLLRVVDLIMLLFPLSFVIFSPLRQRVGDMAAGTIVVNADAPEPPPAPPAANDDA